MDQKIKNLDEYTEKTLRGAELFNAHDYAGALDIFLQLADYNRNNFKVYETLAMIYLKLEKIDEAEAAFRKARLLYGEKTGSGAGIKSFEEAVAELDSIEKLEAVYQETTGKSEPGNPDQDASFDRDPELHKLPVMISLHYMARGDYKKAEDILLGHRDKYFKNSK